MWLYEKKKDEIGIYTIEAQKEKLQGGYIRKEKKG